MYKSQPILFFLAAGCVSPDIFATFAFKICFYAK